MFCRMDFIELCRLSAKKREERWRKESNKKRNDEYGRKNIVH